MPNGFTAVNTLTGASTAATSTIAAPAVATNAALNPVGSTVNPTTALSSQSFSGGILRYPLDSANYYLALFIMSYVAPSVQSTATASLITTIGLPIPMKMIDAQSIELNANHRSFVVQMAQQMYSQWAGVGAQGKNPADTFGAITSQLREAGSSAAEQTITGLGNILGGAGEAFEQAMGIAKNPGLTIDLNSQNFKEHNFFWKFSPTSSGESQALRQIINTLKNYSLPALNSSPYFLNYPAMVLPMYIPNQAQLYEFKLCLISSVTVDWNSAGTAAFFTGTQAPVEVSLALRLIEIELWMQGDPFLTAGMS
jgi:hypothetical protein